MCLGVLPHLVIQTAQVTYQIWDILGILANTICQPSVHRCLIKICLEFIGLLAVETALASTQSPALPEFFVENSVYLHLYICDECYLMFCHAHFTAEHFWLKLSQSNFAAHIILCNVYHSKFMQRYKVMQYHRQRRALFSGNLVS